jgi:hypothetical protein
VKDKNYMLADSNEILIGWMKYFSQLLNDHTIAEVRKIDINIVEPILPDPRSFQAEITTATLNRYRQPCSDQIPAELFQTGGMSSINSIILLGIRNNDLISKMNLLYYKFTGKAIRLAVGVIVGYHCY